MKDQHVGYLVVVKQASPKAILKPVGVLTGRDIAVAVVASGVDPSTLTVADVMTSDPVLAHTTDEIEESLPRMRKAAVRRVPVVGSRGELIGILSFDDIFDTIADNLRNIMGAIRDDKPVDPALLGVPGDRAPHRL